MSLLAVRSEARFSEPAPEMRLASTEDVPQLLDMMRLLYEQDEVPFRESLSRKGIELWLQSQKEGRSPLGRIWVVEHHGEAVGYAVVAFDFSLEYGGFCAFLDELFLRAPYRGRGWGSWLMNFLMQYCREHGMGAMLLEAADNNPRAAKLYTRFGFRPHQRVLMSVDLNGEAPHSDGR